MNKKGFKSQASSSRAVSGAFGSLPDRSLQDASASSFGGVAQSVLSHVYEPPDLNAISDPNLVVAFKNLQKKDSTTKAKALEEIQQYIQMPQDHELGYEEAILEAWIKVYPRTSIENSRRVRLLAHTVQGYIAISYGKRIARHLSQLVGPWLAGIYDNDKSVSRAAQDSFKHVFPSEEKYLSIWRLYQVDIATYTSNIIMNESPNTLSDERTTTSDDAMSKYTRALGAVIAMLMTLIETLPDADTAKSNLEINAILNSPELWKLASFSDPFVRRSIYKLLITCLDRRKEALDPRVLSSNVLTSALHSDQTGSAYDYANSLVQLSLKAPSVWTDNYSGTAKKSAKNRLSYFLRKGSRGGSPGFWRFIEELVKHLPNELLQERTHPDLPEDTKDQAASHFVILDALHEGVINRDEQRLNSDAAWAAYLAASQRISISLDDSSSPSFVESYLAPLLAHYIKPSAGLGSWSMTGSQPQQLCLEACLLILEKDESLLVKQLETISSQIIEDLKVSHPEQSKDYTKSQDSLANETSRWYTLMSLLTQEVKFSAKLSTSECLQSCLQSELGAAVSVLRNRNGKPYGAASTIVSALHLLSTMIASNKSIRSLLEHFGNVDVPSLTLSPSAKHLVHVLDLLRDTCDVDLGYHRSLEAVVQAPQSPQKTAALECFLSFSTIASNEMLQSVVLQSLQQALDHDSASDWTLVTKAFANPEAPMHLTDEILSSLTQSLTINSQQQTSLHGLEILQKSSIGHLKAYATSHKGSVLVSRLLYLVDTADEASKKRAAALAGVLQSAIPIIEGRDGLVNPSISIIQRAFDEIAADSLSVISLTDQAQKLFQHASANHKDVLIAELLPSQSQWAVALAPFLAARPNPALIATAPSGLAIALIKSNDTKDTTVARDAQGYSLAFRLAYYVVQMCQAGDFYTHASEEIRITNAAHLAFFRELASVNVTIQDSVPLWTASIADMELAPSGLIFQVQDLLADWLDKSSNSGIHKSVQKQLFDGSAGSSSASYFFSRAFSNVSTVAFDKHGQIEDFHRSQIKDALKTQDIFKAAAAIRSAPISSDTTHILNEVLAKMTDLDFAKEQARALQLVVLLNSLQNNEILENGLMNDIPKQRLVFFVKHVIEELPRVSVHIQTGILQCLQDALVPISEIYGSFWGDLLVRIGHLLQGTVSDETIPLVAALLRLLSLFQKEWVEQANDDLIDEWNESRLALSDSILQLVHKMKDLPDHSHLARHIIDRMLGRQLVYFERELSNDAESLYPVLASESEPLQIGAYKILHKAIPSRQEQISLDKALDTTLVAKLPDELLSLVLAVPDPDELAAADLKRALPSSWWGFLLSWKLIFDHWTTASNALQSDYVKNLQEGQYVQDLLSVAVDVLISSRHKPIDGSKHRFGEYDPDHMFFDREADLHWLLIHLYYLSLVHLPSLAKAWWRDNTTRQTNLAVQTWTEKHISPQIISLELSAVKEWASQQEDTTDTSLTVKVSHPTREITAAVPVDDRISSISVRLPTSYPLARAEVSGVQRVGVAENKWQSWIRNAQGQLTISDGGSNALIDCLLAWRRNVTAAMKGQTECSICYSVVGSDKTLPKKECPTCKNRFHAGCLFRWFKSSNSSSCPLCRNTFAYS
ncbi:uncharacterized protein KY384_007131 [Bacidia gigantensis]|uniref:uncharacterized protein n=1 Tax=Bacidia gigantensis TaxID=2732470 RepID=UPI001D04B8C0|nr:uncharacterized protein KY384_007131 [Bacidia gigantensis]KAG8528214.1 hypothetical protein KY384_007131 [Bacidia gigantensis]